MVTVAEAPPPGMVLVITATLWLPGLSRSTSTGNTSTPWRWAQLSDVNSGTDLFTVTVLVSELDTETVPVSEGLEPSFTQ